VKAKFANLLGFQLVWFSAVGGAGRGWWWAGPLALLVFAALHFGLLPGRRADATLLLVCGALGFAVDSLWVQLGWVQFASALPWPGAAPVWILSMWMGLALTLNHSLAPLRRRPWLAALSGALAAPLAYLAAASAWQAARLDAGMLLPGLALAWAVLTPALLQLAARLQPTPAGGR
jgi:hypothetical protein